jgi:hypothetical protein
VLISESLNGAYYRDEIILELNEEIKDIELVFSFFNLNDDTLKSETISILYSNTEIELPEITIELSPENLNPGNPTYLNMQVTTNPQFSIEDNIIHYVLHPHIGFNPGIAKSMIMSFTDNHWSYLDYFDIPQETKVATFGAGFTIIYGGFKKRIANQKILIYGNWADPIAASELTTGVKIDQKLNRNSDLQLFQNHPNPFNPFTKIIYTVPKESYISIKVYNALGQEVAELVSESKPVGKYEIEFSAKGGSASGGNAWNLPSGIYFYRLKAGSFVETKKMVLLR